MRAGRTCRSCLLPGHIMKRLPFPFSVPNLDLDLELGHEVALIQTVHPPLRSIESGQGRSTPGWRERNLFGR